MKSNSFKNGEDGTDNPKATARRFYYFYITRRVYRYWYSLIMLFALFAMFAQPMVEAALAAQSRPPGALKVSPSVMSKLAREKTVRLILKLNVDDTGQDVKTAHESLKNRLIFRLCSKVT